MHSSFLMGNVRLEDFEICLSGYHTRALAATHRLLMVHTFYIEAKYYARARQAHGMTKFALGHFFNRRAYGRFQRFRYTTKLPKLFARLADKLPPVDPTGINGLT
eukprot:scaffold124901_cov33-Prasinocladus_malaysianus.AAC.1